MTEPCMCFSLPLLPQTGIVDPERDASRAGKPVVKSRARRPAAAFNGGLTIGLAAEIGFTNPWIARQRLGRSGPGDCARLQYPCAACGFERHRRILLDQQDSQPRELAEFDNSASQLLPLPPRH